MVARGPRRDRLPSVPTSPGVRVGGVRRSGGGAARGQSPSKASSRRPGQKASRVGRNGAHRRLPFPSSPTLLRSATRKPYQPIDLT